MAYPSKQDISLYWHAPSGKKLLQTYTLKSNTNKFDIELLNPLSLEEGKWKLVLKFKKSTLAEASFTIDSKQHLIRSRFGD